MLYVGLDMHAKKFVMCVVNQNAQVVRRRVVREVRQLRRELLALGEPFEVVFEASCGYGWQHDLLRPWRRRSSWRIRGSSR
jgi:hypothetical protein